MNNTKELLAYPACEAYIAKTEQSLEVLLAASKMMVLEQKWLDKYNEPSKLSTEIKALLDQVKALTEALEEWSEARRICCTSDPNREGFDHLDRLAEAEHGLVRVPQQFKTKEHHE